MGEVMECWRRLLLKEIEQILLSLKIGKLDVTVFTLMWIFLNFLVIIKKRNPKHRGRVIFGALGTAASNPLANLSADDESTYSQ